VDPNGLAAGKLVDGDILVAVNRITTDHLSHPTVIRLLCKRLKSDLAIHRNEQPIAAVKQRTNHVGAAIVSQVEELRRRSNQRMSRTINESTFTTTTITEDANEHLPPGVANTNERSFNLSTITAEDEIVPVRREALQREANLLGNPRLSNGQLAQSAIPVRPPSWFCS
jgi:hypothetical protein